MVWCNRKFGIILIQGVCVIILATNLPPTIWDSSQLRGLVHLPHHVHMPSSETFKENRVKLLGSNQQRKVGYFQYHHLMMITPMNVIILLLLFVVLPEILGRSRVEPRMLSRDMNITRCNSGGHVLTSYRLPVARVVAKHHD